MAKVLVLGGAGYIGSTVANSLIDQGHQVSIFDDFSTGYKYLVPPGAQLIQGTLLDPALLKKTLSQNFDAVMHFAAKALVAESVAHPERYFETNVEGTQNLLNAFAESQKKNLVFSSTCAVFGAPKGKTINEQNERNPLSPYGSSKLEAEKRIREATETKGVRAIVFRYFNAAGAEAGLRTGECHEPETHLIPNLIKASLDKKDFHMFGTDYPTPDGTCVRDYIHVSDLAAYHVAAMNRLLTPGAMPGSLEDYNLGSEFGFSVKEIVDAWNRLNFARCEPIAHERRPGDPPSLIADSTKAKSVFSIGQPKTMDQILRSAYEWEMKRRRMAF